MRKAYTVETIRCGSCNRKLAEAEYTRLAIKCPRCGAMNYLKAPEPPDRAPRAPDPKEAPRVTDL